MPKRKNSARTEAATTARRRGNAEATPQAPGAAPAQAIDAGAASEVDEPAEPIAQPPSAGSAVTQASFGGLQEASLQTARLRASTRPLRSGDASARFEVVESSQPEPQWRMALQMARPTRASRLSVAIELADQRAPLASRQDQPRPIGKNLAGGHRMTVATRRAPQLASGGRPLRAPPTRTANAIVGKP